MKKYGKVSLGNGRKAVGGCAVNCNVSVSWNRKSIIGKLYVVGNVSIIGNVKLSLVGNVSVVGNIISIVGKLSVVSNLESISCKEESIIGK